MSNYNLTGQKIKDTYSQVAQVNGNTLVNGLDVATPIATSSIVNFPTEVSRSAAAAGFGQGSGGVSEATFVAYTSSNDAAVSAKLSTSVFNSYTSSTNSNVSNLTTRVNSLQSATSSYALKTQVSGAFTSTSSSLSARITTNTTNIGTNASNIGTLTSVTSSYALKTDISGAFTLPNGIVSSSSQIDLAQTVGTASHAVSAITASLAFFADTCSFAVSSISASIAVSASHAVSASFAPSAPAFPFTGSAKIQGRINLNNGGPFIISDWTSSIMPTSILIGRTNNVVNRINVSGSNNVQIGNNVRIVESNARDNVVAIGANISVAQNCIGIGENIENNTDAGVAIGQGTRAYGSYSVSLGYQAFAGSTSIVSIGDSANIDFSSNNSIAIGKNSDVNTANNAIAIGFDATVNANNGIAIGSGSITSIANEINIGGQFRYNNTNSGSIQLMSSVSTPTRALSEVSSNVAVDGSLSNFFTLAAGGNAWTISNPTNLMNGITYTMKITNGVNLLWGGNYNFEGGVAPSLTSGTDLVSFASFGDGQLYCSYLLNLS
jgi:hypothetical protein